MPRRRGRMLTISGNQLATSQTLECGLDRALGQSGGFRQGPQTKVDWLPFVSDGLPVEIEINKISGRLLIVPYNVTHQHIENVVVDGNGLFETRHTKK